MQLLNKVKKVKVSGTPCTATDIEERIDFDLLPLSRYEFNLWNSGLTVGIMRAEAHAAVTNAVIPYRLTGCSGSGVHLPWHRMLPDSIGSSVGDCLTSSQFGYGGRHSGGHLSARICFLIVLSVDSPLLFHCTHGLFWGRSSWCVRACACLLHFLLNDLTTSSLVIHMFYQRVEKPTHIHTHST